MRETGRLGRGAEGVRMSIRGEKKLKRAHFFPFFKRIIFSFSIGLVERCNIAKFTR